MEVDDDPEKRGWFWAIAFLVFAAVYISDGLRDPVDRAIHLTAGVGMLLVVPHAFLYPKQLSGRMLRPTNLTGWTAALGVLLVVTPMEFISTFIVRPVTLALRLLMNMVGGHMLLVLCFSATHFFLFSAGGWFGLFSIGTFAFGFAFTLFEIMVAALQAYVFALLTTIYIQLALVEEH